MSAELTADEFVLIAIYPESGVRAGVTGFKLILPLGKGKQNPRTVQVHMKMPEPHGGCFMPP